MLDKAEVQNSTIRRYPQPICSSISRQPLAPLLERVLAAQALQEGAPVGEGRVLGADERAVEEHLVRGRELGIGSRRAPG